MRNAIAFKLSQQVNTYPVSVPVHLKGDRTTHVKLRARFYACVSCNMMEGALPILDTLFSEMRDAIYLKLSQRVHTNPVSVPMLLKDNCSSNLEI